MANSSECSSPHLLQHLDTRIQIESLFIQIYNDPNAVRSVECVTKLLCCEAGVKCDPINNLVIWCIPYPFFMHNRA